MLDNYFYLRANPDKRGHTHRIGIVRIIVDHLLQSKYATVTASICSLSDNFSSKTAVKITSANLYSAACKNKMLTIPREFLNRITLTDVLRRLKLLHPAEERNINWPKSIETWVNIIDRTLYPDKYRKGGES